MKRACDEWKAVRKGGLAKRVIAALVAVAMLGGLGYATASTAVAQDDTTQQQAQQTEQSAKTTSESQDEKASDSEGIDNESAADGDTVDDSAEDANKTDADAEADPDVDAQDDADGATDSGADDEGAVENSSAISVTSNANESLGAPEKNKRIKKNNDNTYTVNVDVTGAQADETIVTSESVDFTLVLDTSSSMTETIDGTVTKLQALKDAVDNFLDKAADANKQSALVKVSLISFNGSASVKSDFTDDFTSMKQTVSGLTTSRGTRSELGLQKVNEVTGSRDDAKQVVIFFTDGAPQYSSHPGAFSDNVAANAVTAAKALKDSGKTIYSIGVVDGADPSDTTKNINKFLNAVSNNYPKATAEFSSGTTTFNLGDGGDNGYYKVATNASDLYKIFEEIQKKETVIQGFTGVSIEDTLSEYVELSDENYTVTAKDVNGNEVALEENTDYTLTYNESAKKFTVVFLNTLGDHVTYTLAYNVKPTQEAYDEYAANGYGDTIGDEGTDLDGNTTSSGQPGFHSNESACLTYTANNVAVAHACSDNPYPHPVIQVVSSTLHIEKQWKGNGNKPETVTVDVKRGDDVYKTVALKADNDGKWTADVAIPAGEEKTYTVTETNLSHSWKPSYRHKLDGDDYFQEGNEVTVPQSPSGTSATVIITNSSISVASLPLTGGTTDRQWLLIGGGIAGMAMLMIGAAGIWRGRKRLV